MFFQSRSNDSHGGIMPDFPIRLFAGFLFLVTSTKHDCLKARIVSQPEVSIDSFVTETSGAIGGV